MKRLLLMLLMIVPFYVWGQTSQNLRDCGESTWIEGLACMLSDQYLITAASFAEYAEADGIRVEVNNGSSIRSYSTQVVQYNTANGWCLLRIEDPQYRRNVSIRYGVSNDPLRTVFYVTDSKQRDYSVAKLVVDGTNYRIQQSVTRDAFDAPILGSPVFDNAGNLVGTVVAVANDGMSATVQPISALKVNLSGLGVKLPAKRNDDNIAQIRDNVQPCIVTIKANVMGSRWFADYCSNYSAAQDAFASKDYLRAKEYFIKAKNAKRKPADSDVASKISLCSYWIYREQGDAYAQRYEVDLAAQQYDWAYSENVPPRLKSEVASKQSALRTFQNNVSEGDRSFQQGNYSDAYSAYLRAEKAAIKPRAGSAEMRELTTKINKSRRYMNNQSYTTFVMVNASPSWSYGVSIGGAGDVVGYYFNLMSSPSWSGLASVTSCGSDGLVDGKPVTFTGQINDVRLMGQVGLFFRMGQFVSLKLGVGYGTKCHYLQYGDGRWAEYSPKSYTGPQATIGLMYWVGRWAFSVDVNTNYLLDKTYTFVEPQFGLGFRF